MSDNYPNLWITEEMSDRLALLAGARNLTQEGIFGAALRRALDAAEAASTRAVATFDPRLLTIVAVNPFVAARYTGQLVGVGVEIYYPSHALSEGRMRPTRGQLLMDWAPWFSTLVRLSTGKNPEVTC